jgi:glycosyltransferase involved in cell wall biosynthesis
MKILQIIPSIALVYGGPSQMVRGLSAALARRGVEVTVLTTNANGDVGQPPLDVPLDRPVNEDGYKVRYFNCSPFRRYKFSLDLLGWLDRHARDFDLAHLHALFSPVISGAATIARRRQLPYILRPLGTLDPADLRKKSALKQVYTTLWERGNLAGASAIHFTSQQEAKISNKFGINTPDIIVPLGVHLPPTELSEAAVRQQLQIPPDRPLLLFLSRIEPKKGLDLLIPALENLLNSGRSFHFVLAGSNPQDPAYETQIKTRLQQSPLAESTTIPGFVSGGFKTALLQSADLFILPSYYENFGIAVAEAMAAGTAVCISRGVYIWEDVIEAGAGWICDGEIASLTESLESALSNLSECKIRGSHGQSYAKTHYSWDAIATRTVEVYREILER